MRYGALAPAEPVRDMGSASQGPSGTSARAGPLRRRQLSKHATALSVHAGQPRRTPQYVGPHRASTPADSSTPPPQEPAGCSGLLPLQELSHIAGNPFLLLTGVSELRLDFLKQPDNPLVCRGLRALTGHRHLPSHLGWESSLRLEGAAGSFLARLLYQGTSGNPLRGGFGSGEQGAARRSLRVIRGRRANAPHV
jgi:hypothetical protein